jgi:hypothetical protein
MLIISPGHVIFHAVNHQHFTAEDRVHSVVTESEVCGEKSDNGRVFFSE